MRTLLSVSLCLLIALGASGATYVIYPDGSGDFERIKDGISAASDGDTLLLADGVFTGYGNYDLNYYGKAITICSASDDPTACAINCNGSMYSQHRGVYFSSGEGRDSVFRGIGIRNGYMAGQPMPPHGDCDGAAIRMKDSSPSIINCRFINNKTTSYFAAGYGGAVNCAEPSSPLFVDCVFKQNESGLGGAVRLLRCTPIFIDCVFLENIALSEGGAVSCGISSAPEFYGCQFIDNEADEGGALSTKWSSATLEDCTLAGNRALEIGGGAYCIRASTCRFTRCMIVNNSSQGSGGGLELYGYGETLIVHLTDVEVAGNTAATYGGGIHCRNAELVLEDGLVTGNTAGTYGTMTVMGTADASILGTTFADNHVQGRSSGGAALFVGEEAVVNVARSLMASNTGGAAVVCENQGSVTLSCCDIFGNPGGDWVGCIADQLGVDDNFCEDPLLCRDDNLDDPYTLHGDSPCLPANSPCGDLVGALDQGCEPTTPVVPATWGAIKAMYR
jgi:predicted outer membrane repeat protein